MIVLSPEGKAQTSAAKIAGLPQFTDLRGKVVGLLDNSKPNADKLAERFAELLKERVRRRQHDHAAQADRAARRAETISRRARVAGGLRHERPGRLRLVHVVECPRLIEIQKRGRFAVTLITHAFDRAGKVREGSFRRAGSSGAGRAASDRHGEDRRSQQAGGRGV